MWKFLSWRKCTKKYLETQFSRFYEKVHIVHHMVRSTIFDTKILTYSIRFSYPRRFACKRHWDVRQTVCIYITFFKPKPFPLKKKPNDISTSFRSTHSNVNSFARVYRTRSFAKERHTRNVYKENLVHTHKNENNFPGTDFLNKVFLCLWAEYCGGKCA